MGPGIAAPKLDTYAPRSTRVRERLLGTLALAARPGEARLVRDERQGLVVDLHLLRQVFRRRARLRQHHCHRLADMAYDLARERPALWFLHPGQDPAAAH